MNIAVIMSIIIIIWNDLNAHIMRLTSFRFQHYFLFCQHCAISICHYGS